MVKFEALTVGDLLDVELLQDPRFAPLIQGLRAEVGDMNLFTALTECWRLLVLGNANQDVAAGGVPPDVAGPAAAAPVAAAAANDAVANVAPGAVAGNPAARAADDGALNAAVAGPDGGADDDADDADEDDDGECLTMATYRGAARASEAATAKAACSVLGNLYRGRWRL